MEYLRIQNLVLELKQRIKTQYSPYEEDFKYQLKYLNEKEKEVLSKQLLDSKWNVGTLRILAVLQDANVITASDYIIQSGFFDKNAALEVMKEFLESEEYSLLGNVIIGTNGEDQESQIFLNDLLEESLTFLFLDFEISPNIINVNYFASLQDYLDKEALHLFAKIHFNIYLTTNTETKINEVFKKQIEWREELNSVVETPFGTIMKEIIDNYEYSQFITDLLQLSNGLEISWKYYFWFVRIVNTDFIDRPYVVDFFKSYLKRLFKQSIDQKCSKIFSLLFCTAKELSCANDIYNFSKWYKTTIGDMNYYLKKHEFLIVLEHLNFIASNETDQETLKMLINTYLPPPLLCNKQVLSFKHSCRSNLAKLKHLPFKQFFILHNL